MVRSRTRQPVPSGSARPHAVTSPSAAPGERCFSAAIWWQPRATTPPAFRPLRPLGLRGAAGGCGGHAQGQQKMAKQAETTLTHSDNSRHYARNTGVLTMGPIGTHSFKISVEHVLWDTHSFTKPY